MVAYSSNYTLYGDLSRRVMDTLSQFTPHIEVYSVDEAFLDFSGSERPDLDLTEYGRLIRSTVKRWTDLPVAVGIGETKTLAKVAQRIAKKRPEGVLNLARSPYIVDALARTAIEDVWGIGPSHSKLLQGNGIMNALQFREADFGWVRKHMGVVGVRMVLELRGTSFLDLGWSGPPKVYHCFPLLCKTHYQPGRNIGSSGAIHPGPEKNSAGKSSLLGHS